MTKTVIGLFDRVDDARHVVRELIDHGFKSDDMSLIVRQDGEYVAEAGDEGTSGVAMGAGAGAAVGGLGGLMVGLAALAIPGIGPVIAAGPLATTLAGAGLGAAAGGIIGALTDLGVPEEAAHYYAEGVRRGGALVSIETDDDMANRAAEIMGRSGAVDIDEHAERWRQRGWRHFDPNTGPYQATDPRPYVDPNTGPYRSSEERVAGERQTIPSAAMETAHRRDSATPSQASEQDRRGDEGEVRVPIVEEQLHVGKRRVEGGGVRLYTRVTETPVEETVRLREEHVTVERHSVDRPASEADFAAFKVGTIEVSETREEPLVTKRTRVVEEIVVSKDVEERSETVTAAARRTEVEVEPMAPDETTTADAHDYEAYDADFRNHYTTKLASRGDAYERWAPAYRYGYDLASDRQYTRSDWTAIEPEARRRLEARHQGTWEEFKDTIRYAWDKVRGRR